MLDWAGLGWACYKNVLLERSFAWIITFTVREIEIDDGAGRSIPASDSPTRKEKYKLSVVQASRELSAIVLVLQLQFTAPMTIVLQLLLLLLRRIT